MPGKAGGGECGYRIFLFTQPAWIAGAPHRGIHSRSQPELRTQRTRTSPGNREEQAFTGWRASQDAAEVTQSTRPKDVPETQVLGRARFRGFETTARIETIPVTQLAAGCVFL